MKKRIVIGGEVLAKDGDVHYINAWRLCELYKFNPQECFLFEDTSMCPDELAGIGMQLRIYRPKSDGNYNLQEEERE